MTRVTVKIPARFVVLAYRVPPKPTAARVAVWRHLKKIGAVYLQDSVCALPDTAALRRELRPVLERIEASSGRFHLLPLRKMPPEEEEKLVTLFVEQSAQHYQEIIENCEVNFVKEIEFERFRKNFTYEEAEEIRMEFEKIETWFVRVQERDFFGAPNHDDAKAWLGRCEKLLEAFEATVFEVNATDTETMPAVLAIVPDEASTTQKSG